MIADTLTAAQPEELVGSTFVVDDKPETAVAGLPMTLVVAGLEDQLAATGGSYTQTDYLTPVIDAVALLRQRHEDDAETLSTLDASLRQILSRVVSAIQQEWDVDLSQLGLDAGGADYSADVQELYRFFVVERLRYSRELVEQVVIAARKQLVERYRKAVEKKNQTVAEARRVFAGFDDVVIWISMPQILEDLRDEGAWGFDFADSLVLVGSDGSSFLARLASQWNPEEFASAYCAPALLPQNIAVTQMELQDRWMAESPKKTDGEEVTE
jgi:hypothetical protein